MQAAEQWLDIVANNLANASTTGFKRTEASFNEDLLRLLKEGSGEGKPIGELGRGPGLHGGHVIWQPGAAMPTGNPLDAAIQSERGLFQVQTPQGIFYTRSGSFSLNATGQLATKSGHLVLDEGGSPIQIPAGSADVKLLEDGRVMAGDTELARLPLYDGRAIPLGTGIYLLQGAQRMEETRLIPRSVEASNVNAVEEMVGMVKLHRAFDMAQKSIQAQDEATGRLIDSINRP